MVLIKFSILALLISINISPLLAKELKPVDVILLDIENLDIPGSRPLCIETEKSILAQGSFSYTGNKFDFGIIGRGYFVLLNSKTQERYYTRKGEFVVDSNNNLVSKEGYLVLFLDKNSEPGLERPGTMDDFLSENSLKNSMLSTPLPNNSGKIFLYKQIQFPFLICSPDFTENIDMNDGIILRFNKVSVVREAHIVSGVIENNPLSLEVLIEKALKVLRAFSKMENRVKLDRLASLMINKISSGVKKGWFSDLEETQLIDNFRQFLTR